MANAFLGFLPDSFAFFRELADNNNKAWFEQNRARYDEHVVGAFRGLLATLEPFLLKLNPQFETGGKTNRSFSRINRDIRFSKDKSPYKPNFYLYVFDRRRERGEGGRLYVGLSAECLTVGFSIYGTWGRGPKGALRDRLSQADLDASGLVQRAAEGEGEQGQVRDLLAPRRKEGMGAASRSAAARRGLANASRLDRTQDLSA